MLEVVDLAVKVGVRKVLHEVTLSVRKGSIHAVMGPNGSGKSTLAYAIMGREGYEVVKGDIRLEGESIVDLPTEERSLRGIFLAMQEPPPVVGVRLSPFLIAMANKRASGEATLDLKNPQLISKIFRLANEVGLPKELLSREVNVGFSGGEKKRSEILQLMLADPKVVILDEPDSGLDVDGVRKAAQIVGELRDEGKAILLITHYARIFQYVEPDEVSIIYGGRVVETGGPGLAHRIEREGYKRIIGG